MRVRERTGGGTSATCNTPGFLTLRRLSATVRMHFCNIVGWGLVLAVLCCRTEAKPVVQAHQKSLRTLLGEELAEYLASGERGERNIDPKTRARLLRDLRADTRSRAAWSRLLNEYPNTRKFKGMNKKGLSKGCFGLKLDRIGAMSGLGC
ncbi:C-type natriuretic peptide [Anomaloglossus baeobatrachus]|uniref:C-type natriuretic peptide n=1 Tax=Anomaloglossus baeobatrachus TaxID=238106 RepID=UPI003F501369